MIKTLFTVFMFVTIATSAIGQTVSVRSGEHSEFTRLVLRIPATAQYDLNQEGRNARLTVDLRNVNFDLSQVFTRIPRTRLADISQSRLGGALELLLACDCDIRTLREGVDLLVLDITDPVDAAESTPSENYAPSSESGISIDRGGEIKPTPVPSVNLPLVVSRSSRKARAAVSTPVEELKNSNPEAVELLERRLIDQIERASEQDLLYLAGEVPKLEKDEQEDVKDDGGSAEKAEKALANAVIVTTSIDRDLAEVAEALETTAPSDPCIRSEKLALHQWSSDLPFDQEIGRLRTELVGEFDKINHDAVVALAKAYIHFGFGAEARQTLSLLDAAGAELKELRALANAVDGVAIAGKNPFSGQQHCATDAAMWSVLTTNIDSQAINYDAVMQGLSRLPDHLRVHLGPILSRKFANFGDKQSAQDVLRVTNRVMEGATPTFILAEAAVSLLEGNSKEANDRLEKVAEVPSEYSPEAAILLVDNKFETRMSVPPNLPDLVAGYAIEYRGHRIEKDLQRAFVISLALSDQFSRAFREIEAYKNEDAEQYTKMVTPVLHLLTERSDDVTFLKLVLHHSQEIEQELPANLADKIAERLLDLGFSEQAQRFLFQIDMSKATKERRMLKARAALGMELPHQAMVALLGLEGPEVTALRVQAVLQKKDFQTAGEMLHEQESSEVAARSLWHSNQIEEIEETVSGPYSRVSEVIRRLQKNDGSEESLSPLAKARALVENSSVVRDDVSELLMSFSME